MKRVLTAAIVAALSFTLASWYAPGLAKAEPRVSAKECRYQGRDPGWWTDTEVKLVVLCFSDKLNVSGSTAVYISGRETGGTYYPRAYNSTGCGGYGCLGIFQMHALYYPGWAQAVKPWHDKLVRKEVWYNPRWNALVATTKAKRDGGWSAWSTA